MMWFMTYILYIDKDHMLVKISNVQFFVEIIVVVMIHQKYLLSFCTTKIFIDCQLINLMQKRFLREIITFVSQWIFNNPIFCQYLNVLYYLSCIAFFLSSAVSCVIIDYSLFHDCLLPSTIWLDKKNN